MRKPFALAATTALAMALAACGSPPEAGEEVDDTTVEDATPEEAVADVVEEDGEADGAEVVEPEEEVEAPAPTASATPTPTPTPTPTATVAAAPVTPPAAFSTCGVCHSIEPGQNGVGPTLAGVVGRRAGSVAGANYSPAMQGANVTWTEANLRRYLLDPNAVVPGTTMPAPGLNAAQAQAVVNYLKTL